MSTNQTNRYNSLFYQKHDSDIYIIVCVAQQSLLKISATNMSNIFTTTDALAAFANATLWSILMEPCYVDIAVLYK